MVNSLQDTFDALADPTRRSILQDLAQHDELTAGQIAERVDGVGRTAVSSHLRILRTAGLVSERREGRYRFYAIEPDGPVRDAVATLHGMLRSAIPASATAAGQDEELRRSNGRSEAVGS
ncbi:hypothetical protein GCM10023350_00290 [Nocardioides endophyticus]|uniref:HTH arsR-type domain-containing protein n=1 Tax=Nocardioides endophyticus TaxID=1353775 RepID=A0ABP8Y8M3_9ACTN